MNAHQRRIVRRAQDRLPQWAYQGTTLTLQWTLRKVMRKLDDALVMIYKQKVRPC